MDEVIAWVNEVRALRGIGAPITKLPRGVQNSSNKCPLARALGEPCEVLPLRLHGVVFFGACLDNDNRDTLEMPLAVASFVDAFDRGEFPDLCV